MIQESQKHEILGLLEAEARVVGSYNRVATKLGVSSATISNNVRKSENWASVSDGLWVQIGRTLGYKFNNLAWQTAETENLRIMRNVLQVAQTDALFVAISEKAGSGKTASIRQYKAQDNSDAVYVLQCEEWGRRAFLLALAQCCGVDLKGAYLNVEAIGERVVSVLKQKSANARPLLVLDEADKLRPSALRWLIHLYNKLEDEIGVVIVGTENLRVDIRRGVARSLKGYDEIDSRFGRSFVRLMGCTRADAQAVAVANGLSDEAQIEAIWQRCNPVQVSQGNKYIKVVEDMRVLRRQIIATTKLGNR